MFSYYGSKSNLVHYYPKPKYDKIIEPFCGSARYSLKYFDRDVTICDKYDVVIKIWKYLQNCSKKDILGLPKLTLGLDIRGLNISEEERLFLGMNAGISSMAPRNKVSSFAAIQNGRKNKYKIIADNLFKIKHWEILLSDYSDLSNDFATWFIDAPYQFGGHAYIEGDINFNDLKKWSIERNGHIIVCENTKANWMKFKPITKIHGAMSRTTEAIWSNFPTNYDCEQFDLFKK